MSMFRRGLMLAASQTKKENPIYGVKWSNDISTTMYRTDDSVWLRYTKNDDGSISSDFNDVFPWNEAKKETLDAGEFLHMPDMYFRIGVDVDGHINSVAVSDKAHEVGDWYKVNSFYYGLYGASENADKLASLSGKDRLTEATRGDFRTKAKTTGSNYFQLDLYHKTVMTFLWWIEWATKNSESIMPGKTLATGAGPCQTGGTDEVSTPSGFNTTTKQMRYHYIEDFVGNYLEWIDGVAGNTNNKVWVSSNPDDYADTNGPANYKQLVYATSWNGAGDMFITDFDWDPENPFLCYYSYAVSSHGSISFCDCGYLVTSSNPVMFSGASWNFSGAYYGLCFCNCASANYTRDDIGGRLLCVEPAQ